MDQIDTTRPGGSAPERHATGRHARERHALEPLGAAEIAHAVALIRGSAGIGPAPRFVSVDLVEPPKHLAGPFARQAFAVLLDPEAVRCIEAHVDLDAGTVVLVERPGVHPGVIVEEFALCEAVVKADPGWQAAMLARGIADHARAIIEPWSVGSLYGRTGAGADGCAIRTVQALTWLRHDAHDVGYGRPVDGLIAMVDLATLKVIELRDEYAWPLPRLSGAWTAEANLPHREGLRALDIVQPDGPSFEVDGHEVRWQGWGFRIGFTAREGLVLHEIGYLDAGTGATRPIVRRAALSEMQVPYGDPTMMHATKNVFDVGEYGIGRMANSLTLGCDCLGTIRYFDAHVANMAGEVETIANAICLHEEDAGTLWKHTDWHTGHVEVRRSRVLVVSFFATVGNYDYGFYWILDQIGGIRMECRLTGCLSVGAFPPGRTPTHGALVAPQLYAPIHQHFFSFRLDMDVDGSPNNLVELGTEADPLGADNPYGGCYRPVRRQIASERDAARDADPATGRSWLVESATRRNALGNPTAYRVVPGADTVRPFAQSGSSLMRRAGFIAHTLWATAYDPAELYAAGAYPNQNPVPDGLAVWQQRDRSLVDADLVLWVTVGCHHVPRPEDWPVMPVVHAGFELKPAGFFDRNPAMDLPPPAKRVASCCG